MNCIDFFGVSFSYPFEDDEVVSPVFKDFSISISSEFTSIIGPNGVGKSTFMLLASGRLVPQSGCVKLFNCDIASLNEQERNLLASVIYQNMEFETQDKVESLLSQVYENGNLKASAYGIRGADFFSEVVNVFELAPVMSHALCETSKGENQRVILAFSLLYGSKSIFMDEPFFALEDRQKENILSYLCEFSSLKNIPIFVSMHDLDLSKKYAQKILLIKSNSCVTFGTPQEVMTRSGLEAAYGIPTSLLRHHENMTRESLLQQIEEFNRATGRKKSS